MSSKKCTSCKKGFLLDQNVCREDTKIRDLIHLILIISGGLILILALILVIALCYKRKRKEQMTEIENSFLSTKRNAQFSDSLNEQAVNVLAAQMKATKQFKIEQGDIDPEELKNTQNILERDFDMKNDHYKADISGIGHDRTRDNFYSDILNIESVGGESRESGFLGSINRESHQLSKELLDSLGG